MSGETATFQGEFLAAVDKAQKEGTLDRREAGRLRRAAKTPRGLARIQSEVVKSIHDENPNAIRLDAAKNIDWAATFTKLKDLAGLLARIRSIVSLFGG